VLVTHAHPDHAPAAAPLGERLAAPVVGYGPGPEFSPDTTLADGESYEAGGLRIVAVHTPGHTADHLCYLVGDVLFTGDHIMGGSTVVIEDAAAYMASLEKVLAIGPSHLYPGHGPEMPDAKAVVERYIAHRHMREQQIVDAVECGAVTIGEIVSVVYADLDPVLHGAAAMQVEAVLKKLVSESRLSFRRGTDEGGAFHALEERR
jgi:glyoxylase-like metal-dependent hydrolase (beta-lactamase superfamily II)